jgi:hypothetical protein
MALAANFAELFDFEGHFEAAAQVVLTESGINSFIARQTEKIPGISTGVVFSTGPALDQKTFLPIASGQTEALQEYFRYTGDLQLTVQVERDSPTTPRNAGVTSLFAEIRSLIRRAFMGSQWPFNDTNLEFYRVSNIRPNGSTEGVDQGLNRDTLIMRFEVTFAIMQDAWPANTSA